VATGVEKKKSSHAILLVYVQMQPVGCNSKRRFRTIAIQLDDEVVAYASSSMDESPSQVSLSPLVTRSSQRQLRNVTLTPLHSPRIYAVCPSTAAATNVSIERHFLEERPHTHSFVVPIPEPSESLVEAAARSRQRPNQPPMLRIFLHLKCEGTSKYRDQEGLVPPENGALRKLARASAVLSKGRLLVETTSDLVTPKVSYVHANWFLPTHSRHLEVPDLYAEVVLADGEGGCGEESNLRLTFETLAQIISASDWSEKSNGEHPPARLSFSHIITPPLSGTLDLLHIAMIEHIP